MAESEITPRLRFPAKNEDDPNQSILAEGYEETYQNSDAFPRQENYARPTLPASENPYNQQEFGGGGNYYQQRPTKNKYQNQFNRYPKPYDQFQRPQRPYDEFDRPQKPYDGFYRPQKPYDGFDRPQKPYDGFDRPQKPYDGFYRPQKPYDEFDRPYQRPQRPQRPYDQFQRPYDQFQRPYDPFQRPQRPYRRPYPGYDPQRPYPFREPYPGLDPQQLFPGPGNEGPLSSLAYALQSISRYDDQKCVPRLLCEVAAGGNPSTRQNSFLPSFNTMESLFT